MMAAEIDDETAADALSYGDKSKKPSIHPAMDDPEADPNGDWDEQDWADYYDEKGIG